VHDASANNQRLQTRGIHSDAGTSLCLRQESIVFDTIRDVFPQVIPEKLRQILPETAKPEKLFRFVLCKYTLSRASTM